MALTQVIQEEEHAGDSIIEKLKKDIKDHGTQQQRTEALSVDIKSLTRK